MSKFNKETVSWLTTVPASDQNFKSHLATATLADCEEALKWEISKSAHTAIAGRMKKLSAPGKTKISPRPSATTKKPEAALTVPPKSSGTGQVSQVVALRPAARRMIGMAGLVALPPTPHVEHGLKDMTLPELEAIDRGLRGLPERLEGMSGVAAVLSGLVLTEIKGRLKHGEWKPWLQSHYGKAYRTAAVGMQIATAFIKSAARCTFEPEQLTLALLDDTQSGALDLAHPVVATVAKWTDGRSARQLIAEEVGDGRANNPGGFRPNALYLRAWLEEMYPNHPEYLENADCFGELPPEVQKRYKAEGQRYEERLTAEQKDELAAADAARQWNAKAAEALHKAQDALHYHRATDEQLAALEQALGDFHAEVRKHLQERAGKRPAKKGAR